MGGETRRSEGPPYRPVIPITNSSLLTGIFDRLGVPIHRSFLIPTFFRIGGGPFLGPSGLAAGPGTGPPFVQGGYLRTSNRGNRSRGPPPRAPSSGAGEATPTVIPEEILSPGGGGRVSLSLSLSLSPPLSLSLSLSLSLRPLPRDSGKRFRRNFFRSPGRVPSESVRENPKARCPPVRSSQIL